MIGVLVSFPSFESELPKDSNHVLFILMSWWIVFGIQALFNKFKITGTLCSLLPSPPQIYLGCQKNGWIGRDVPFQNASVVFIMSYCQFKLTFLWFSHAISSLSFRVSQSQHCEHFGLDNSLLWGAFWYILVYLAASLASPTRCQEHPPCFYNKKCVQTLPMLLVG